MTPKQAYDALVKSGDRGMDDPDTSWYPVRWYFNGLGVLSRCPWRGTAEFFPEFVAPETHTDPGITGPLADAWVDFGEEMAE